VLILILFKGQKYIKPVFSFGVQRAIVVICLIGCIVFGYYVLHHLPVKDFRPYKIGQNIADGMIVPEGAPKAIYDYAWKFNVAGEEKIIVTRGDYPSVEGDFIDVETTEVQKGYEPPIHDFTIERNGEDFAPAMLEEPKLVMVISYDLQKSDREAFKEIKKMTDRAIKNGYKVIGMSASSPEIADQIITDYKLDFDFYFTDETALKTIVRSNP